MSILQGLQKNSVLILIVAVAFCVVLLGAVTFSYYISVDSADDLKIDEKVDVKIKVENNSIQASTSVDNNSPVVGLASNNVNGLMNNMENIPKPKPKVFNPIDSYAIVPERRIRSAQESGLPYFFLIGQSKRRALSRLALSGQEFNGAKRILPPPPPPRPSVVR